MKKIIESLFNLIFAQPENISESEKTPFWQMALIIIFIGLMFWIVYLYG